MHDLLIGFLEFFDVPGYRKLISLIYSGHRFENLDRIRTGRELQGLLKEFNFRIKKDRKLSSRHRRINRPILW